MAALLVYYPKRFRYGLNAILAALDTRPGLKETPLYLAHNPEEMAAFSRELAARSERTLALFSFPSAHRAEISRLAAETLALFPPDRLFLLAGGAHPTAEPEDCLSLGFHGVIRSEGEQAFLELMERWLQEESLENVPALVWNDETGITRKNASLPPLALDTFPPFPMERHLFGHIEITRGCPFACAFCQTAAIHGTRPRHRSLEGICYWAREMLDRGKRDLRFITPNAFGYGSEDGHTPEPEAVENLLARLREIAGERGRIYYGTFPAEVRPEHVSPRLLQAVARYADNTSLLVGAQSGSEKMLERCHRGHDVETVRRAVQLIREAGLEPRVDVIFGLPGEDGEDRQATIALMEELTQRGALIHTHTFMPIPQTGFAHCPPGKVHPDYRAALSRFTAKGMAYGNWREQEDLARRMARRRERQESLRFQKIGR